MLTNNHQTLRKFNPGTGQTDEDIKNQFVVRQHELASILDTLRDNIDSSSCQHTLIIAPRGQGKSMLLERAAVELRSNPLLANELLPVRFMEESLEILTIADFWLECILYLATAIEPRDPDKAMSLRQTRKDLITADNTLLELRARATVLDTADALNCKLVLMIENFQDLSAETDEKFGWTLRKLLQSESKIILLATATNEFSGLTDVDQPFFELFRMQYLKPLTTDDCIKLWKVVTNIQTTPKMIKPIQILSGGNPRLLVLMGESYRQKEKQHLIDLLLTLIDNHTEYFRSHLDNFAPKERKVFLSVIDLWQPSTTKEIANRARIDIRSTSSLLGRLQQRGVIISEGKSRAKLYSSAERLYSLYYKLRREKEDAKDIKNFMSFMEAYYLQDQSVVLKVVLKKASISCNNSDSLLNQAFTKLGKADDFAQRGEHKKASNIYSEVIKSLSKEVLANQVSDNPVNHQINNQLSYDANEEKLLALSIALSLHFQSLLYLKDNNLMTQNFQLFNSILTSSNTQSLCLFINLTIKMVIAKIKLSLIHDVITSNYEKKALLQPLIVALQQDGGEQVRAPIEIIEIAADIREEFHQ